MDKHFVIAALLISGCPGLPDSVHLDIEYQKQARSNWCWAACDSMVLKYYGINKEQWELETEVFGAAYDYSAGLGAGLEGLNDNFTKSQLSDYRIRFALASGHPVVLGYTGPDGSHFRLIEGYDPDCFTVYDSAWNISCETYSELQMSHGMTWDETHEITPVSEAPQE